MEKIFKFRIVFLKHRPLVFGAFIFTASALDLIKTQCAGVNLLGILMGSLALIYALVKMNNTIK